MSQERYAVTPTSSGVRKSGASTRAVTVRPAYAGAASSFVGTRPFGLGGLGTRRQRYWVALIGTLALLLPYAGVIGSAIKAEIEAPAAIVPIPALSVPAATFPKLAVPRFRAYRAAPPLASNLRQPRRHCAHDPHRMADDHDHHEHASGRDPPYRHPGPGQGESDLELVLDAAGGPQAQSTRRGARLPRVDARLPGVD